MLMNFTLADTLGILKACLALAPFLLAPGYVISSTLNLFGFRDLRLRTQFALSVPIGIAVSPIAAYTLARLLPSALLGFYVLLAAIMLILVCRQWWRSGSNPDLKFTSTVTTLLLIWAAISIGCLTDLQFGNRLYPPLSAYDHSTRAAIGAAITRHVPPTNPFFANSKLPFRYHYFWLLVCELAAKAFGISPRHSMLAGVFWCGLGVFGTLALAMKFLLRESTAIQRKVLIGIALLCVTGLDILPTLLVRFMSGSWPLDMEWWNEVQISSWATSLLWVPHHVAATIACFVGFALFRVRPQRTRAQVISAIVAGMAFASATGLSVLVTFTFALGIGLWLLALAARREWKELGLFLTAGGIAAILIAPFLMSLSGGGSDPSFVFAVRPFPLGTFVLHKLGVTMETTARQAFANLVFLPVNYALELGFFFVVGILRIRFVRQTRKSVGSNELALWTVLASSFLVGTFLHSSATATNDLGFRCFLPAQLILLVWAATLMDDVLFHHDSATVRLSRTVRGLLLASLFLGGAGTAYEVFMLRAATVLYDQSHVAGLNWMDSDRQLGKRTYALRTMYESVAAMVSPSAIVQNNPATDDFIPRSYYSGRDSAADTYNCSLLQGEERVLCEERVRRVTMLYAMRTDELQAVCREYGIDVIVAQDTDPAWNDPESWVWQRRPLFANDFARAFECKSEPVVR